jgi:predicted Rossmann-fold nucleotide-binding protein
MPVADYRLRARRVGAVGGSRITALNATFCELLGEQLAREEGLVIVTGGRQGADAPAADACIIEGARRYLHEKGIAEDSRLETLIPKGESTGLFRAGRIHEVKNVTRQSRRFALVRYADVLVTIEGEHGTPEMVDLALEFEKPVLPLPFTGGKSEKQWHDHKDVIAKRLRIDEETCQRLETPLDAGNVRAAAQLVKDLVVSALKRRCFVAMPFASDFKEIYRIVKNACDSLNLIPVRTDELPLVGNVVDIIREGIASCECAVAVITGENPNVMYELGLAHALYKPTLLICENDRGGHLPTLPFDLQTQDVVGYSRSDLGTLQDAIHRKLAMTVPHD